MKKPNPKTVVLALKTASAAFKAYREFDFEKILEMLGISIELGAQITELHEEMLTSTLDKIKGRLRKDFDNRLQHERGSVAFASEVNAAFSSLPHALQSASTLLEADSLVAADLDPSKIAKAIADKAATSDAQFGEGCIGREILIQVVQDTIMTIRNKPSSGRDIQPSYGARAAATAYRTRESDLEAVTPRLVPQVS